jgi:hypothetical protein
MSSTVQRYAPSGAFKPAVFLFALGGLLGAVALAWVYELLLDLIPFVYISMLMTVGFGFGLGLVGAMVVKAGHCRNRAVAAVLALLMGAGGLAASYGWGYRRALNELAEKTPGITLSELHQVVSVGTWMDARIENGWEVRRSTISGAGVMAIWGIEALIALGLCSLVVVLGAAAPYCERCQVWTETQSAQLAGLGVEDVASLIERGDLAGVLALTARPEAGTASRIELLRNFCPECPDTAYLTVKEVRTEVKNGKAQEHTKELLEHAELSPKLNAVYVERFPRTAEGVAPVAGSPG